MNTQTVRRVTGVSGVTIGILGVATIPLYFMYTGNPPAWNVLTRNLITLVTVAVMIVFLAGLRELIRQADTRYAWIANIAHGAGLVLVSITMVAHSMEVGGVLGQPSGSIDPTVDGPLAEGSMLLHGSVARIVTTVLLAAAGYAILRTAALPAWVGWSAYVIAAINFAFLPSLYFGPDAGAFYSAIGWGNSALAASLLAYWVTATGIAVLRPSRRVVAAAPVTAAH